MAFFIGHSSQLCRKAYDRFCVTRPECLAHLFKDLTALLSDLKKFFN
jgi:hypothetical protein